MIDEVNQRLDEYFGKWRTLIDNRQDARNKEFFERLKPTKVGWKVTDWEEYKRLLEELRPLCDQVNEKWMNERWIASMHLKDSKLSGDIEVIELVQRRPGSADDVGLDHVDFLCMEETNAKAILEEENDIHATDEVNGDHDWTSIWFDGTEAKLKGYTVFDSVANDSQKISNKIRGEKFAIAPDANVIVAGNVE